MYCVAELDNQSEYWSVVLLERDWSMLKALDLSSFENTQGFVESPMIPSAYSSI